MEQHYDLLKALVDKKPEEARFQTGLHLHDAERTGNCYSTLSRVFPAVAFSCDLFYFYN